MLSVCPLLKYHFAHSRAGLWHCKPILRAARHHPCFSTANNVFIVFIFFWSSTCCFSFFLPVQDDALQREGDSLMDLHFRNLISGRFCLPGQVKKKKPNERTLALWMASPLKEKWDLRQQSSMCPESLKPFS